MLTRAFLLLLAMMTGLSAAQAEGGLRSAAAKHAMRSTAAQLQAEAGDALTEKRSLARFVAKSAQPFLRTVPEPYFSVRPQVSNSATVYRSDRALE